MLGQDFNIDAIVTLKMGVDCIEQNYVNKVAAYLKDQKDLGFNNQNFTKSYS